MEAVMFQSSSDQYKNYVGSSNRIMNRIPENVAPANFPAGLLQVPLPPPFLYQSFPLFPAHRQQPPILPLPAFNLNLTQNRTFSCPPNYGRINNNRSRNRDQSLTPKKSKQVSKSPRKAEKLKSTVSLGPDPENLPKNVPKVLSFSSKDSVEVKEEEDEGDKFSGSVIFTVSPPPSSLPLPTFSLRPKLSCNAEAAGIDTGATDSLCRLLRLR